MLENQPQKMNSSYGFCLIFFGFTILVTESNPTIIAR